MDCWMGRNNACKYKSNTLLGIYTAGSRKNWIESKKSIKKTIRLLRRRRKSYGKVYLWGARRTAGGSDTTGSGSVPAAVHVQLAAARAKHRPGSVRPITLQLPVVSLPPAVH